MSGNTLRGIVAAALSLGIANAPAVAARHTVTFDPVSGTFLPKYLEIAKGDTVKWEGLGHGDAIVRIGTAGGAVDPTDVCFATNASDPAYNNPYKRAFNPGLLNEFTGPDHRGVSGIWALSPEGGELSNIEIPSAEAEAITPGITAADGCAALDHPENDVLLYEDPLDQFTVTGVLKHRYELAQFNSGETGSIDGNATDPAGAAHVLCSARTDKCNAAGNRCGAIVADPAVPATIAPGTYLNGLLASTYANPDVTGVVLRFNWKDLQYDAGGTITERWEHLDRELERAIAGGKLVTLDVRAGMFGTPDWIFDDYLVAGSAHAAPWCTGPGCAFTSAPASAGQVRAIEFLDHYGEEPPGDGCGSRVRIGAPGDLHYRALYKDFIARLAAHITSDARWFQAVAHVKVSGANLRTSEAELPHHCDDQYTNTADHQLDPKASFANRAGDRVLDVFKTLHGARRETAACLCNTEVWFDHGYIPQHIYDYYAEIENQIVISFFGRKSLGYQILQDGFPRADAGPGGSFRGDHLYREVLVDSSVLVNPPPPPPEVMVNAGYEVEDACAVPSAGPAVYENPAGGTPEYCSSDLAVYPYGSDYTFLAIEPLLPSAADSTRAAYVDDSGDRFPQSSEQSEVVLDQAGNGRFGDPTSLNYANRIAGKLFVPQHSGLQPLPQERIDLDYGEQSSAACDQQVGRRDPLITPFPPEVGVHMADFPIPESASVSTLAQEGTTGCPNHWIVNQGKDQDSLSFWIPGGPIVPPTPFLPGMPPIPPTFPPLPPIHVELTFPPQLIGFQTSNKVRSIAHVESALFNLTYNTNAVFIELYEDAIWRIGTTKGTSPTAMPLDDPTAPLRTNVNVCDQGGADVSHMFCYSKNLAQWAAELHVRRAEAAALWSDLNGIPYPALEDPFPSTYKVKFLNNSGSAKVYAYINPSRCDPADVDTGPLLNGAASALGVIKVLP